MRTQPLFSRYSVVIAAAWLVVGLLAGYLLASSALPTPDERLEACGQGWYNALSGMQEGIRQIDEWQDRAAAAEASLQTCMMLLPTANPETYGSGNIDSLIAESLSWCIARNGTIARADCVRERLNLRFDLDQGRP